MTPCEGNHDEAEVQPPAVFQWCMVETTSLDGIVDLCLECSLGLLKAWPDEAKDVPTYEVRLLQEAS